MLTVPPLFRSKFHNFSNLHPSPIFDQNSNDSKLLSPSPPPISCAKVVSISLATLALYMGGLQAARVLHRQMLKAVIRSPMSTFFDVTPVGRILNRFSHEINEVDNEFPSLVRGLANCFFSVQLLQRPNLSLCPPLLSDPYLSVTSPILPLSDFEMTVHFSLFCSAPPFALLPLHSCQHFVSWLVVSIVFYISVLSSIVNIFDMDHR